MRIIPGWVHENAGRGGEGDEARPRLSQEFGKKAEEGKIGGWIGAGASCMIRLPSVYMNGCVVACFASTVFLVRKLFLMKLQRSTWNGSVRNDSRITELSSMSYFDSPIFTYLIFKAVPRIWPPTWLSWLLRAFAPLRGLFWSIPGKHSTKPPRA